MPWERNDIKMKWYPNAYFNNVEQINVGFLHKNRIKALILDVDNTLINYHKEMKETVIHWVEELKAQGIKLYILSNTNHKEKVEEVAKNLAIPYRNFAKKPFKSGFLKVQKDLKEQAKNIGVVGDQIFTDILGGNRCNMFTILVEPIDSRDFWYTAWKRPIENKIKKDYQRKMKEK